MFWPFFSIGRALTKWDDIKILGCPMLIKMCVMDFDCFPLSIAGTFLGLLYCPGSCAGKSQQNIALEGMGHLVLQKIILIGPAILELNMCLNSGGLMDSMDAM